MMKKQFAISALTIATGASLILGSVLAIPAAAATASVSAGLSAKAEAKLSTQLPKIASRSDVAIDARIADLNKLNARVADMKNVSAAEKTSIATEVQAQIAGLTALKSKIDADTDATVARADEKAITGDFRIYALVVPRGLVLASADRVATIISILNTAGTKMQARIAAAQAAGKNVAALQASLTDMGNKMNDAGTQAQAAYGAVVALVPDKGDVTIAASNKAALVLARKDIKAATSDLQAARKDAKAIADGLKKIAPAASASVTASTTVSQ